MNLSTRVARSSPVAKLLLWASAVALTAGVMQLAAAAAGLEFSVFDKSSGGTAVILAAFACLLALMAVENRPLADYGLVADASWRRRALTAAGGGAAFYLVYLFVMWRCDVILLRPDEATPLRWLKAVLAGWSAAPVAVTAQIIFSGYLLSTLRERHSRVVAVVVPALLFAVATAAVTRDGVASPDGQRLIVGVTLLQTVLGLLRLRTGSIVVPAGLLAGCILVRKFFAKSRLLGIDWDHPNTAWLAPAGDPRQGAAMWVALAVAVVGVAIAIARYGERQVDRDAGIDASFKRYMPFSNLFGLAPLDRWAVLLWQARLRVGLLYLPRLAVSLAGSAVFSLLALPERLVAPLVLRHDVPPPVFIVGMPRSGTTHLHNLLALDPQFRSPRNYECFNPHGFLTGWLSTALLTPFMTWRRPMDAVQMTVFSAQEEEFALATMGSPSPYWAFCLPREIDRHDRYWRPDGFNAQELTLWRRHYRLFLRKLTAWRRRTPLLKNPANTGRVAMLRRLFPDAKFVHIVRHPHAVWRSNQRLAEHGFAVFQVQTPDPMDNYATRCLANYRSLMDAYYADTRSLPEDRCVDVRFEDLEATPREAILGVYRQLGIEPSPGYLKKLDAYLEGVEGYRKNKFAALAPADRERIDRAMAPYLRAWGYTSGESAAPRAA